MDRALQLIFVSISLDYLKARRVFPSGIAAQPQEIIPTIVEKNFSSILVPHKRLFNAYILLKVDEIPRSEVIELFQKCQGMPDIVQLDMTAYIYSFGFRNLLNTWKAAIHRYKVGHSYYSHGLQSYYRLKGIQTCPAQSRLF